MGLEMSADKPCRLFMPVGFVDGYGVLNNTALFEYRCTDIYHPGDESVVRWEGPDVGIEWPAQTPLISEKGGYLPGHAEIRDGLPVHKPRQC